MNNLSPAPSFFSPDAPDSSLTIAPIFVLSVFLISEGVSNFETGLNFVFTDGTAPDPFEAIEAAFSDLSFTIGFS